MISIQRLHMLNVGQIKNDCNRIFYISVTLSHYHIYFPRTCKVSPHSRSDLNVRVLTFFLQVPFRFSDKFCHHTKSPFHPDYCLEPIINLLSHYEIVIKNSPSKNK